MATMGADFSSVKSLQPLLAIEDEARLDEFVCTHTGLPLWPLVRVAFLRDILSELLYDTPIAGASSAHQARAAQLANWLRTSRWNAKKIKALAPAPLLLTTNTVSDEWREGKRFNRLSDPFSLLAPGLAITLLDQYDWTWPLPRADERILFNAPLKIRATLAGALKKTEPRSKEVAAALMQAAYASAQKLLGWQPPQSQRAAREAFAAKKLAALPSALGGYRALIEKLRPKCLLAQEASYGPLMPLVVAAKEAGASVAEYQHGAITPGHDAYNFGQRIQGSVAYRKTLPDYFLSYGRWWEQQINLPARMIPLGNPARDALQFLGKREKTKWLIISDGIEFNKYLELARQLLPLAKARGHQLALRPHPLERARVAAMSLEDEALEIDLTQSIYASIAAAHAVISEASTALFDAVGLCERIFAWRTPKSLFYFPTLPFQGFETPDELKAHLQSDRSGKVDSALGATIWEENWSENFKVFMKARLL